MPVLLFILFSVALGIGAGFIVILVRRARRKEPLGPVTESRPESCPFERSCLWRRPDCWLAIKSRNLQAVQSALGLHNAKRCSWSDALAGEEKLFISPPVKGWILVIGSGLPDPAEDIDACFRFLVHLSRRLGQVQYFFASRILHHHAWARIDAGRIIRAYAWAGGTLWHQGHRTPAEADLGLKCFDYGESAERISFSQPDAASVNTDKVPLLAGRWSIDPGRLDDRCLEASNGIAGEPSRRY